MSARQSRPAGAGRRFAIITSRFNELITNRLTAGARACLLEHGVQESDIALYNVPGAWELPLAAQQLARRGFDGIIAIGCVIRGDTPHFEYVAGAAADGLARVSLDESVPVAFGVLTVDNDEQAMARAGGKEGNKGWEAALAALEMVDLAARFGGHEQDSQ
jgi:6,7-dimethyl-8-ribityllumazine synthase